MKIKKQNNERDISKYIDKFSELKVAVVGDIMLDRYIRGTTTRISPEAPVPVLSYESEESMLGGAGNVAHNLSVLGAKVFLFGSVGDDKKGELVCTLAQEQGIDCAGVMTTTDMPTTFKERIIADGQHIARVDHELRGVSNVYPLNSLGLLEKKISEIDVVVVSDYKKGVLSDENIFWLVKMARTHNVFLVVDTKPARIKLYKGAFLFTPNEREVIEAVDLSDPVSAAYKLSEEMEAAVLLTRGPDGVTLVKGAGDVTYSTRAKEIIDVSGAGDTVSAVASMMIAAGSTLEEAAYLSNLAGSIVVTKSGTASVLRSELIEAITERSPSSTKIHTADSIQERIATERADGRKIVFTNGCFDILHQGHIAYLEEAREQGDFLIVGVNSDDAVRMLKGAQRPINTLADRVSVLSALSCVDAVVSFDETTANALIELVRPDVYVKGGDYSYEDVKKWEGAIVEKLGGTIHITPKIVDRSTSSLISKVLEVHRNDAHS